MFDSQGECFTRLILEAKNSALKSKSSFVVSEDLEMNCIDDIDSI